MCEEIKKGREHKMKINRAKKEVYEGRAFVLTLGNPTNPTSAMSFNSNKTDFLPPD